MAASPLKRQLSFATSPKAKDAERHLHFFIFYFFDLVLIYNFELYRIINIDIKQSKWTFL